MRRRFAHMAIGAVLALGIIVGALLVFAPTLAQTIDYGKVIANTSFVNVRNGPGDQFPVIGVVSGGTELRVTGISGDGKWFQVDSPFGKGFVFADFVLYRGNASGMIPIIPPSGAGPADAPVATVIVPALNVRSEPFLSAPILGVVPRSLVMSVTGRSAETGWYRVVSPFGTGWVSNVLVSLSGNVASIPDVDVEGHTVKAPASGTDGKPVAVVNATTLNVRSGPGTQFALVGWVTRGTVLEVTGRFPDFAWWEVASPFGEGKVYVSGDFVVFQGNVDKAHLLNYSDFSVTTTAPVIGPVVVTGTGGGLVLPGNPHVVVNTSLLNVHSGPGGQFPIIGVVAGGTELVVTGQFPDAKWWQVGSPFGTGYVSGDYVLFRGSATLVPLLSYSNFPATPPSGGAVVATGTSVTGVPAGPHVVVNTSMMNVRSGPGGHLASLGVVSGGTVMAVTGQFPDAKWWEVESPFGKGYVSSDYVLFRGSAIGVPLLKYESFPGY